MEMRLPTFRRRVPAEGLIQDDLGRGRVFEVNDGKKGISAAVRVIEDEDEAGRRFVVS